MKKLLLAITVQLLSFTLLAQTYSFSPSPGNSPPACPGIEKSYVIAASNNSLPSCTYIWTATNGIFVVNGVNSGSTVSGANMTAVVVKWNDTHNGGTLKVEVSGCPGNSPHGELASSDYSIATFAGQSTSFSSQDNFGNTFYGAINIPYCTVPIITISVDHIYMNNTGGAGQTPLVEAVYVYNLPTGWKQYQTNATGAITTTINSIVITPVAGSTANCVDGGMTVQGIVPSSYSCGSPSNLGPIPFTRTGASTTLSLYPSNYSGPSCGNQTPVTFTAQSFSCSATYIWNFPSGWSGASSTNSITLTPSGGGTDVGPIQVSINLGCSPHIVATYNTPAFHTPVISSGPLICAYGATVTISNVAQGVYVNWSGTNLNVTAGQGTSSVTMSAPSAGSFGSGTISASVNCPNTTVNPVSVWVGTPSQPGQVSGEQFPNVGSIYQYTVAYGSAGAPNYDWLMPYYGDPVWAVSGGTQSGPIDTLTPNFITGSSPGWLQVFGQNACGNSGVSKIRVFPQGGPCQMCQRVAMDKDTTFGKIAMYPIPADEEFTVRLKTPAEHEADLSLLDLSGNVKKLEIVHKGEQWITFVTRDILPGMYIVKINDGTKEYYRKVIVRH